jgi:threonine dehydrogenase-like Zn-dependent dehydrogenase
VTLVRAVRLRLGSAPRLVHVPRPDPGRGEVRVAVAYTGICHTDLHFIDGERAPRMADEVRDPHLGDRIRAVSGPPGLDVAFDCVGAAAVHQQAFDAVGRYGRVVLVGVADGDLVLRPGAALVRLERLDLTRSVSTVLDLDDVEQGLRVLRTRLDDPVRVLLAPAGRGAPGSS